ncbi:hypothetical protein NKR19_g7945 [Coniochaeta hoffmannii]|uniref:SSCRP protein n=1 Tax=Coniochaeta hoffmannii TaxID=91930 RepID=A0AA38RHJ3_9PEZI|nr:hypothetical protein NKR19_g7945 [Coniochaeta hoffmannii]
MKVFFATILALAAAATAAPTLEARACAPGTYSCTTDAKGWQVCDVSGKWVYAGGCPPDTHCEFYVPSASPYCVPAGFVFPSKD